MSVPCRILVVDDDADIRDTMLDLLDLLELLGHEAAGAADGLEALAKLETGQLPGLIFLDLMMPKMDGIEFRHRQLENPAWASVPVVVMSAQAGLEAQAREMKATAFQRKPCNVAAIKQLIENHCAGPPQP